ncbi:MAG: hypothetical protein JO041_11080 [Acidobacteria bacterium]|nr:hypothetical protein [Acidobacteriota bacterium]
MFEKHFASFGAGVLLAVCVVGTAVSAPAQGSQQGKDSKAAPQPAASGPAKKILTNRQQPRMQAAMDELAAAMQDRAQNDPRFKAYMDAVSKRNHDVEEFVKTQKGGKQ